MTDFDVVIERTVPESEDAAAMAMKLADSMLDVANHLNTMRLNLAAFNITLCGILLAARGRIDDYTNIWPLSIFLIFLSICFFLISLRIGMTHGFHWDEYITYRTIAAKYYKIEIS